MNETLTVPVLELTVGRQIPTDLCGTLTVIRDAWAEPCEDHPELDRVYVDIQVDDPRGNWDTERLAAAAGAEEFWLIGMSPTLRYRLTYLPNVTATVLPPSGDGLTEGQRQQLRALLFSLRVTVAEADEAVKAIACIFEREA